MIVNGIKLAIVLACFIALRGNIRVLLSNRDLIISLASNDLKLKYAGSALGIVWAFVQPVLTTLIYWFVFQLGFKSQPVENFPFILWLISGLTPWFYFGETVQSGTASISEYTYLVKKVLFNVNILPVIKTSATFLVHIIFVLFVGVIFVFYGVGLSIYALQLAYYAIAMLILATGLVYLLSALQVFLKDTVQIVSTVMQLVFWSVPIVWDISQVPSWIQSVLKWNPLFYIVEGYRDALINHVWFWEKLPQTLSFWAVAMVSYFVGVQVFKRLTPHFADVL